MTNKIDFPSFLRRRRHSLKSWCESLNIKKYNDFVHILEDQKFTNIPSEQEFKSAIRIKQEKRAPLPSGLVSLKNDEKDMLVLEKHENDGILGVSEDKKSHSGKKSNTKKTQKNEKKDDSLV